MDWVRSLRIGCGMMSRGEVGLIVTAMGASTGIFNEAETAVMVGVVLLTTLLTPIALRSTFNIISPQDVQEGLNRPVVASAETVPGELASGDITQPMAGSSIDQSPLNRMSITSTRSATHIL
jgi:Kef-type K+ transport system membrane component KefB